jgi:hypothetical protein
MKKKLIALNKKDIDSVSGGVLPAFVPAMAMATIDTAVALTAIDVITGAGDYFCAGSNSTLCGGVKAACKVVSFSNFGYVPILNAVFTTTVAKATEVATAAALATIGSPPGKKTD